MKKLNKNIFFKWIFQNTKLTSPEIYYTTALILKELSFLLCILVCNCIFFKEKFPNYITTIISLYHHEYMQYALVHGNTHRSNLRLLTSVLIKKIVTCISHQPTVPLLWILWQFLLQILYCKFLMPKALKWGIFYTCTLVIHQDILKNKYKLLSF